MEEEDTYCPNCGEKLDDFSPCGCTTTHMGSQTLVRRSKEHLSRKIAFGGMRSMVARRLAKKGKVAPT